MNVSDEAGDGAESPDCLDPTRPARRAEALGPAASMRGRAGAGRKALFWSPPRQEPLPSIIRGKG